MGRRRKKTSLLKAFKKGMKIGKMMSKALDKFMDRRDLDRWLRQKRR
ncbi:hypothetical protein RG963_06125 [Methanosarcina sp. Z-7115]|uniref:Uncharacterized protein n=1 Tax=Methanosarcina baikalica TaxID=3073890 RepID=A0ABU2D0K4_9EURY|nr:hypothetical protein [Methanosarcina sp. Z-7115]MDR7665367.1 hypothetical protein [Methanosarcina sp. Z-7115]